MKYDFFIVGLGQIGGSLALALREAGLVRRIYGKDRKYQPIYSALIDDYVEKIEEGIKKADFIILSVPVSEIIKFIDKYGSKISSQQILVDTGSTKYLVVEAMRRFPGRKFFGGHPMAGTTKRGEGAWDPNLFAKKRFFLCFPFQNSKENRKIVNQVVNGIGAIPTEVDPAWHDFWAARTSHLPYVISLTLLFSYLSQRGQGKRIDCFISKGFLEATRLALTPPDMGRDLILTNKENVIESLKAFSQVLNSFAESIEEDKLSAMIERVYQEAEKWRVKYEGFFEKG